MAVVLFVFLCSGCGGKVSSVQYAADFDPLAADEAKYAVGGFVLGEKAEQKNDDDGETLSEHGDHRAQTDAWSALLYGPFLVARAGQNVWSWSALADNIPADAIAGVHQAYAVGGVMPQELLTALKGDLPDITYLVLARVDRNEISISEMAPASHSDGLDSDGGNVPATPSSLRHPVKTRRTVAVTMDVYDLHTGLSAWTGSVERVKTELVGPDTVQKREDLVVTPAAEEGAPPEIRLKGPSLEMPDLEDLLAEASAALVNDLFKTVE